MSDPEPIDFDFSPPRPGGGEAGGALEAGTRGAPGTDEVTLDPSPVAGEGLAALQAGAHHGRRAFLGQVPPDLVLQLLLVVGEIEVHAPSVPSSPRWRGI